jgi:hypothetical protein
VEVILGHDRKENIAYYKSGGRKLMRKRGIEVLSETSNLPEEKSAADIH